MADEPVPDWATAVVRSYRVYVNIPDHVPDTWIYKVWLGLRECERSIIEMMMADQLQEDYP